MKNCNTCEVELTDENWTKSNKKLNYYMCRVCYNEQKTIRRNKFKNNPENLQNIYNEKDNFCNKCNQNLTINNWSKANAICRQYLCKECYKLHGLENRQLLKEEVIRAYGGKCVCCSESNSVFLNIDHINDDGNIERKGRKQFTGEKIYRFLRQNNYPKENYQLLCFNCNWAKHALGKCPHKS